MEKTLGDIVRVLVVIDMFMMPTMIARPQQDGILEGAGAEDEREQPQRQHGAERHVGKQAVITERDAETSRSQQHCKHGEVKPINTEIPEVKRHRG